MLDVHRSVLATRGILSNSELSNENAAISTIKMGDFTTFLVTNSLEARNPAFEQVVSNRLDSLLANKP